MNWGERIAHWFVPRRPDPVRALDPGLHHYMKETSEGPMRYHLRVDPGGGALLIAGAAEAVRLSAGGALLARDLLAGETPLSLQARWPGPESAERIATVARTIEELGRPSGRYPVFNLADPAAGESGGLMAPFQADLVPGEEASTFVLLDKLWEGGVPHARFVGLEADDLGSDRLVAAVRRAEDLGMITGVRVPAAGLAPEGSLEALARVGLDYAVVPDDDDLERLRETFARVRLLELCPVAEVALFSETLESLEDDLERLAGLRVDHVEVFAVAVEEPPEPDEADLHPVAARELRQVAAWVEELSESHPCQVVWLPPVHAAVGADPNDLAASGPRAGGDISVRVEADGRVFAARGPATPAGNLRQRTLAEIWGHEVFAGYRDRVEAITHCDRCPGLAVCAAACPADPDGWSRS